jgi:hypothetical protein
MAKYFNYFPKVPYFLDENNNSLEVITNLTTKFKFDNTFKENSVVYYDYIVKDGETPEIIAEKVYGSAEYHWIIMLANDKYDYIEDFPLSEPELVKVIASKYTNPSAIHHYEDANGFVVNSTAPGAVSVSNDQYERDKNEQKRRIKIISPNLINKILQEYKDLL